MTIARHVLDSLLQDLELVDSLAISASKVYSIPIMGLRARSVNDTHGLVSSAKEEPSWSTTEMPLTPEEEDAIVTLVVVVIGIIAAIVILFSMGIFIDCKHQKKDALKKKKKLKLKMPPISRIKRSQGEDGKSLASDMCPTGASDVGFRTRDAIV